MKFSKRIISFLCTSLTITSFISPAAVSAYDKEVPEINVSYYSYDVSAVSKAAQKLISSCRYRNNSTEVKKAYDALLDEYDAFYTAYLMSMIQYNYNYKDSDDFLYMTENADYCASVIFTALKEAVLNSQYSGYLQGFMKQEDIDYLKNSGAAVTTVDFSQKNNDLISEYQLVNSNRSYSIDTKSLKNAEIYLELIQLYKESNPFSEKSIMEILYDQYGRDYTISEILSLSDAVKDTTQYLYSYLDEGESNYSQKNKVYANSIPKIYDPMENVVFKYAGQISDDLKYSADFLKTNSLYSFADSEYAARGQAFTTNLPKFGTPYIFIGSVKTNRDVKSCIHEFGHFSGFLNYPETGKYFTSALNTDIAEIQSQGMELLFFKFYKDIYGEKNGKFQVFENTIELLDTLSLGFMLNEFENYVFEHSEEMSASDVVAYYNELKNEYNCEIAGYFGNVQNIFLSPGYCISYGVSLLPAMELISYLNSDYSKAVELYTNISKTNTFSATFQQAVADCGFRDPLKRENISALKYSIADYSDSLEGIINGDINNDQMLSSSDILKMQSILLTDDKDYDLRKADTNRDNDINIVDLIMLNNKFQQ